MSSPLCLHFLLPLSSALHGHSPSLCLSSFFFFCKALFSSSCHCCTLSSSWDPFDVVRHCTCENPLHLGQYSVLRLILHDPISGASQYSCACMQAYIQTNKLHTPINHQTNSTIPLSRKLKQDEYAGSQTHTHTKRASLFLLFYHATEKRGERHHGYDPPGGE